MRGQGHRINRGLVPFMSAIPLSFNLPKLRPDVILSQQDADGATVFIVKAPVAARFYRFREVEGLILQNLDGAPSLETLRLRVEEKFGARLSLSTLEQFVDKLRKIGLLQQDTAVAPPAAREQNRVRGNLFYLRLKAVDPDGFFDRLLPAIRFCFTPAFLVCSAALVTFAAGLAIGKWSENRRGFLRAYYPQPGGLAL